MAQPQLDLEQFRRRLEEMRASFSKEIADLQEQVENVDQTEGYGVKNHPAEDATELFDRQRSLAIQNEVERELRQVEHALRRIEAGQYGICEVGGEVIPVERLEARPAATLCIVHQRERDEQARDVPDPQV
jgi:DnaK suppressor protein